MSWIKEYLEKQDRAKLLKFGKVHRTRNRMSLILKRPAKDFVDSRISIFKSSDEFKKTGKEQQIVALKNYKKH
ncbi:MAG: hypothetical protein IPI96_15710 [Saprospiraceae bacterium]|nr:hypothetical protein [Saprospiraceae bacterium]